MWSAASDSQIKECTARQASLSFEDPQRHFLHFGPPLRFPLIASWVRIGGVDILFGVN